MFRGVISMLIALCALECMAEEPDQSTLQAAVAKALPLVQTSAVEFTKHRDCFSCHHQALPVFVLTTADRKGFAVDQQVIRDQVAWTAQFLKRNQERYLEGQGQGGQVDTAGYAMWTLATGDYAADELTSAVCHYLLVRHADIGHWTHTSDRPPSEASDFTTTFLAIQSLQRFANSDQQADVQRRIEQARAWLEVTPHADTEDLVFRLRALCAVGADASLISEATAQLLKQQRDDGGWAQKQDLESDSYATGSVLSVLKECGALDASHDVYQRGVRWLLERQLPDGSWHVTSRSDPFQEYFETGFPHGADQFISMSATCWSLLAIMYALPDESSPAADAPQAAHEDREKQVRAVLDQQVEAWNAGNLDAFMDTYWKSDELSFSSGGQITRGWQATMDRYWQRYPDKKQMGTLKISNLEVTLLGESAAMVLGQWHLDREMDAPQGNFTLVLRHIDGNWRIIHDHTSLLKDDAAQDSNSETTSP